MLTTAPRGTKDIMPADVAATQNPAPAIGHAEAQ